MSWRRLALWAALAVAYVAAGKAGLLLAYPNPSISAVWPPTGLAIAALVLGGLDLWPAIAIGAFVVNLSISGDPFSAAAISVGNTLEGVLGAFLTLRYARGALAFERPSDVLRYAVLAGGLSTMVSASIGVTTLFLAGATVVGNLSLNWFTWWVGDAVGAIEVGLLILVVADLWRRPRPSIEPRRVPEALAFTGVTAIIVSFVLFSRPYPIATLLIPPTVWAAFRYGPVGAAVVVTSISVAAIVATEAFTVGPFSLLPRALALDSLRIYIASLSVTGMLVAADHLQRERAESEVVASRDELESRVRERTARLVEAQSLAHLGNFAWDGASPTLTWSDEMFRIYGYGNDRPPITIERSLERIEPSDRPQVRAFFDRPNAPSASGSGGSGLDLSFTVVLPDGERRVVERRLRPAPASNGGPAGWIGTDQDVTEKTRLVAALRERERALLRSNRDLEEFAYVASHDLQEPLGVIEGYTRLLGERYRGQLGSDADQFLGIAHDAAQRMRKQIDDLLDWARIGALGPRNRATPVGVAVDEAIANLRSIIEENQAQVRRAVDLPTVRGDPTLLRQVFQNLLSNALRFRGPDAPRISIEAEARGPEWLFSVRDNGIGVAPEYHEQIFAVFQRLHPRDRYPGSGIGLAVCKRVVERLGGRIWIESRGVPGEGSVVRFTLPVETAAEAGAPLPTAPPVDALASARPSSPG